MKNYSINNNIQLNKNGELIHLLGLQGLSKKQLTNIIHFANTFIDNKGNLKKSKALKGMSIANLFFEPSTRTRNTFEIAAKRSSANVINVDLANSATKKKESLLDTMYTLQAMQIDMFVIRHKQNGLPHYVANNINNNIAILNAGDGVNAHPTQALLDMLTIYQYKKTFTNLSVAIVGDIIHSRVAHSDIQALKTLGVNDIRLIAPPKLQYNGAISTSIKLFKDLKSGIKQCDVIITLRIQKERMLKANIPNEKNYFNDYGLTKEALKLAKKDVIIMHPGPVNRNIEIDSDIIDSDNCVILKQVTNGIAVRMAVMNILAKNIKNLSL